MQDDDVTAIDPIKDHVVSNRKASQVRPKVWAQTTKEWIFGEQIKPIGYGSNQSIRTIRVVTFLRDIKPYVIQIATGFGRDLMRHQAPRRL